MNQIVCFAVMGKKKNGLGERKCFLTRHKICLLYEITAVETEEIIALTVGKARHCCTRLRSAVTGILYQPS